MRRHLLVLGLLLAASGPFVAEPPTALAAETGAIQGRLANGTAGGGAPAGAEVVLHVFRGEAHAEDRPLQAASDGSFSFDRLELGAEYTYLVTASYAGLPYSGQPLRFGPGERDKRVELTVYETTDANPGLRVRRATFILTDLDVASQTLQAVELISLENPSDRAYLPTQSGPAGPMGLLRFPLPPEAGDLRPGPGLESAQVFQVDRGFATDAPSPPGTRDIIFSYRFPYQPGRFVLQRSVPYATAELRIVVPPDGPSVEGPDLQPADPVDLGGRRYRVSVARDLPAGQQVAVGFGNLPGRWAFNLPLDDVPAPVWGGFGASLALALVAGYAWRGRRRPPAESRGVRSEPTALLAELAVLDEAFAGGQVSEETYAAQRAEIKARLLELLSVQAATLSEPPVNDVAAGELRAPGAASGASGT